MTVHKFTVATAVAVLTGAIAGTAPGLQGVATLLHVRLHRIRHAAQYRHSHSFGN
jgi:hypothetical protein